MADVIPHDEHDIEILGRTIWGEARGETVEGQIAVAWVIRNRAERAQFARYQLGIDGAVAFVCLSPWQFSAWNEKDPNRKKMLTLTNDEGAAQFALARKVLQGEIEDPTRGADHYHVTAMREFPDWATKMKPVREIGRHTFYDSRLPV